MADDMKCPVRHGFKTGDLANKSWWPEQLNVKILNQNAPQVSPLEDDFDYVEAFNSLDYDALKKDLADLITDSQDSGTDSSDAASAGDDFSSIRFRRDADQTSRNSRTLKTRSIT